MNTGHSCPLSAPWLSSPGAELWRGTQEASGAWHVLTRGCDYLVPEAAWDPRGQGGLCAKPVTHRVHTVLRPAGVPCSARLKILLLPMVLCPEGGEPQPPAPSTELTWKVTEGQLPGAQSPWLLPEASSSRKNCAGGVGRKTATRQTWRGLVRTLHPRHTWGGSSRPIRMTARDAGISAKPSSLFPTRLKHLPGGKHFPSFPYRQSDKQTAGQYQDLQTDLNACHAQQILVWEQRLQHHVGLTEPCSV